MHEAGANFNGIQEVFGQEGGYEDKELQDPLPTEDAGEVYT